MKVEIEVCFGKESRTDVKPSDLDVNIEAQFRAMKNSSVADTMILMDTVSILRGIQRAIKNGGVM